jgi:hypothetical protein
VLSRISLWKNPVDKIIRFSIAYESLFRPFPPWPAPPAGRGWFSAQYNILYPEKSHKIRTVCPPARAQAGKSRLARVGTCESSARSDIAPHRGCIP